MKIEELNFEWESKQYIKKKPSSTSMPFKNHGFVNEKKTEYNFLLFKKETKNQ